MMAPRFLAAFHERTQPDAGADIPFYESQFKRTRAVAVDIPIGRTSLAPIISAILGPGDEYSQLSGRQAVGGEFMRSFFSPWSFRTAHEACLTGLVAAGVSRLPNLASPVP